jgi:hypothetical protein
MIDPLFLQSARSSIRHMLKIPEEEIVDLVFLASVLANFDPERQIPVWLVIVGSPSSGKTELTSLIRGWKHTWALPARVSAGYFFAARTGKYSTLHEIEQSGKRLLYIDDLAGIVSMDIRDAGPLYSYLIAIHDGHLVHRTGFLAEQLTYGPKAAAERLGFIGSATERFYQFQERWFQFGSRFVCYYLPEAKKEWDDYAHLTKINDMQDHAHHRAHAAAAVIALLDHVLEHITDFPHVTIARTDVDRITAAITLVQRVLGAGRTNDPGVRLMRRVVQIVRMMAFVDGRMAAKASDVANGIQLVLSQLPLQEHKILRFALDNLAEPWRFGDLLEAVGSTRKIYSGPLEGLADVRVLRRAGEAGRSGYTFELHPKARALVDVFDPERRIFPR